MKTKSLLSVPAFPSDCGGKIGLVCHSSQTPRGWRGGIDGVFVGVGGHTRLVDSHDVEGDNISAKWGPCICKITPPHPSHPTVSIKCGLTLCCIGSAEQEKNHGSPIKEGGFGGLGTAQRMENNSCITLQLLWLIA